MLAVNTDAVAPNDRPQLWSDAFGRLGMMSVKTVPVGKHFSAQMQAYPLAEGITLSRITFGSAHIYVRPKHVSGMFTVMLPIDGIDDCTWNGVKHQVGPGSAYLIKATEEMEVLAQQRVKRFMIAFPMEIVRREFPYLVEALRLPDVQVIPAGHEAMVSFAKCALALSRYMEDIRPDSEAGQQRTQALLQRLGSLLHSLPQNKEDVRSRLRFFHKDRVRAYVKENLIQPLNIASIAAAVNLSQSYVYNLFSNEPVPLMKWVWLQRLERCRQDFESPALRHSSIREIAYSWGFNDPAHFAHAFHQYFGISPSEYREHYHSNTEDASALSSFLTPASAAA